MMSIDYLRQDYHRQICKEIIRISKNNGKEYPNLADSGSASSIDIAWKIVENLNYNRIDEKLHGQSAGKLFEDITKAFLEKSFDSLIAFRPGNWGFETLQRKTAISNFAQYEHLSYLENFVSDHPKLKSSLGSDYIVSPDIIILRRPVEDEEFSETVSVQNPFGRIADLTFLRSRNNSFPILHASISCKWTIRSDRSQNTRTEALNLIRNRKGPLPKIVAVTAEPLPTRIASLALGTGDLDCIYHFALYELENSLRSLKKSDHLEMFENMVEGKRLRDISDLPFDLII